MNSLKNIKIILCGVTGGWGNLSNCKMAFTGQKKMSRILAGAKPANSHVKCIIINLLNAELNPTCHLLALLGAHHILHISMVRVNP